MGQEFVDQTWGFPWNDFIYAGVEAVFSISSAEVSPQKIVYRENVSLISFPDGWNMIIQTNDMVLQDFTLLHRGLWSSVVEPCQSTGLSACPNCFRFVKLFHPWEATAGHAHDVNAIYPEPENTYSSPADMVWYEYIYDIHALSLYMSYQTHGSQKIPIASLG